MQDRVKSSLVALRRILRATEGSARALAGRYPDAASALTAIRLAEAVDRSLASGGIEPV